MPSLPVAGRYEGPLANATVRLYDYGDGQRLAAYDFVGSQARLGFEVVGNGDR